MTERPSSRPQTPNLKGDIDDSSVVSLGGRR
jgi:hypothetical protein